MNAQRLLAHFDRMADAPDAIPRLRRFVLDLAVRGKLVEQDPADEPASELLKRIAVEMEKQNGGKRGRRSQTAGTNNDLTISVPDRWVWVKLGQISLRLHYGYTASASKSRKEVRLLRITDIQNDHVDWNSVPGCEIDAVGFQKFALECGDLLIARTGGTIGKTFLVADMPVKSVFASYLIRVQLAHSLLPDYVKLYCGSDVYWDQLRAGSRGGGQPNVNGRTLGNMYVPLPPFAEQHRIVAKVDNLMALCDRLEESRSVREGTRDRLTKANYACLSATDTDDVSFRFYACLAVDALSVLTARADQVKRLRQAILDLAVRGKLVEQDPADEPASELLKRFAGEETNSATSVRRGKRQKPLPALDSADTPYDLPNGWIWARFPELGKFGRGKSKHRPRNDPVLYADGTYPMIQTGDVARSSGRIATYAKKYNDIGLSQSMLWPKGALCISIAANIADSGILEIDACFPDSVVGFVPASIFGSSRYFEYFIRTVKENLLEFAPATAQKNINLGILKSVLIPLPPLAELHRIVAKVDMLMGICDRLEASLGAADTGRTRLFESLIRDALQPTVNEPVAADSSIVPTGRGLFLPRDKIRLEAAR